MFNFQNINAVSGSILKNHPKSWFEQFSLDSSGAYDLLRSEGHKFLPGTKEFQEHGGIIVLQMTLCGNNKVLAELVYAKDYMPQEE